LKSLLYRLVTLEILQEDFSVILKTFLQEKHQPSVSAGSNISENMENNIFAHIFLFFEDLSVGATTTSFQHVYPKIAGNFQQEQAQQSGPIEEENDISFTLDQDDTDSVDDDSDSLDIVISNNILHQSQQVQSLTKKITMPP
jgi:hypothetical protein